MKIVVVPINKVRPYAKNPRRNEDAIAKVAASLKEFGWQQPIVVDREMVVIAGHTRLKAAEQLGLTKVPVVVAADLTPTQVQAYRIADNRTGEEATWDDDLLAAELSALRDADFDLRLTGFDDDELARALGQAVEGLTDPDDTPDLPEQPVTREGDVWLLGKHRLVCGDCTNAKAAAMALAGVTPHLMVTDPPYGVDYDPGWRARAGVNRNRKKLGSVTNDDRADWRDAWTLFPGAVAYVWHAAKHAREVQNSLEGAGFEIRSQIIWGKDRFALSRGHYHWQHEPCFYAVRGANGHWSGDRSQSTLWTIKSREDGGLGHGTQKPVACMKRPIENNSSPGQAVYDPFVGSGTTIIAAEMTGRACHAIEIDRRYVDVTVQRWEAFTGQSARLETGETFAALTAKRRRAAPRKSAAA